LLLLEVVVGEVGNQTSDEHNGIETDANAGGRVVGSRGNGTGLGGLGLGVAGLQMKESANWPFP